MFARPDFLLGNKTALGDHCRTLNNDIQFNQLHKQTQTQAHVTSHQLYLCHNIPCQSQDMEDKLAAKKARGNMHHAFEATKPWNN